MRVQYYSFTVKYRCAYTITIVLFLLFASALGCGECAALAMGSASVLVSSDHSTMDRHHGTD